MHSSVTSTNIDRAIHDLTGTFQGAACRRSHLKVTRCEALRNPRPKQPGNAFNCIVQNSWIDLLPLD